ncbi:AzlC family ABC transporter permease [Glycomyces harbinensis]|uniref:4-azaleucine resistance probable transporter AzlC n=1 Tax=Glycomyces harbinensis TaxID=58114 RepID=A0A1G6SSY8_9ACTN|nr:AzlC family ABC transporter permease [Glycomyces harbinensis]SDD19953.1 4-azaleucine resistance probable transporter AzlC [Glycomyces harbinensis]
MSPRFPPERDRDLYRDAGAMSIGIGIVGVSFGALATSAGLPWWIPVAMSFLTFAATSQFAMLAVVMAGGGVLAGLAAGVLVHLRHIPYGMAVGDLYWDRWWMRLVGTFMLIDQSTAFALSAGDDRRRARAAYWITTTIMFVAWNVGTVVGVLAGGFVPDPDVFGLDAAFPALLLALVMPALKDRDTLAAVLVGALIAVGTAPFLPTGIPVLLALVGLLATWPRRRPKGDAA